MYCPVCGTVVTIDKEQCSECGNIINKKLFDLEPEKTNSFLEKDDAKKNVFVAILAYIGPFVLLSVLKSKKSNFVKFHANQGLLAALCLALSAALFAVPDLGPPLGFILTLISLSLSVLGIVNVLNGTKNELPVIGKIKIIK